MITESILSTRLEELKKVREQKLVELHVLTGQIGELEFQLQAFVATPKAKEKAKA